MYMERWGYCLVMQLTKRNGKYTNLTILFAMWNGLFSIFAPPLSIEQQRKRIPPSFPCGFNERNCINASKHWLKSIYSYLSVNYFIFTCKAYHHLFLKGKKKSSITSKDFMFDTVFVYSGVSWQTWLLVLAFLGCKFKTFHKPSWKTIFTWKRGGKKFNSQNNWFLDVAIEISLCKFNKIKYKENMKIQNKDN